MASRNEDLVERILSAAADLSGKQVDQLVSEARAEAEAEVKDLLKSAIKASLLEEALARIGARETAPQAPLPSPVQSASNGAQATAVYVYCISPADHPLPMGVQPIDPSHPIRAVRQDGLQAIVSAVSTDEFGPDRISERAAGREWVERTVRAHDAVVKAALSAGPIIPLRFGILLRDEQAVRQVLETHKERLAETLASLSGTTEWGVKIAWRAPNPREGGESLGGREYLLQRQARIHGADKRAAAGRAQELHDRLAGLARDSVLLPTLRHTANADGELLLNGAYLVADTVQRQFHKIAAAFGDKWDPDGLTCEVTGPWPAYNFVNLDLSLPQAR